MTQAIEKMRLCLNEMLFLQKVLNKKVADDFCARMLGIYVLIRMDDFTKFAKTLIPNGENETRAAFDELFNLYNSKGRAVRDKLGAHVQKPNVPKDIDAASVFDDYFSRINLYQSVDYDLTDTFVDYARLVYDELDKTSLADFSNDFALNQDLSLVENYLSDNSLSDKVQVSSDWLGFGVPNTISLISCSYAQRKGQLLKSIELMEQRASGLQELKLQSPLAQKLFKRLWICIVVNYYDNLFTRTDLPIDDVRREEGFDELAPKIGDQKYSEDDIRRFFTKFKATNNVTSNMNSLRNQRGISCGHLDENKTVEEIDDVLDKIDCAQVHNDMAKMANLFHYVCREVFLLRMLDLPARSPIYDSDGVEPYDDTPYYKGNENVIIKRQFTVEEAWRIFRKKADGCEEAKDFLVHVLFNPRDARYLVLADLLIDWLSRDHIEPDDANACADLIISSKHGFPNDLQEIVINATLEANKLTPLTLHILSEIAVESERIKVIVSCCLNSELVIIRTYGALIQLKLDEANHTPVDWNRDCQPSQQLKNFYDKSATPSEDLALAMVLAQQWYYSYNFVGLRKFRKSIEALIDEQVLKMLDAYLNYIKVPEDEKVSFRMAVQYKRFFALLKTLISIEERRKQKPNHFVGILAYNQFAVASIDDVYELIERALCYELAGAIEFCGKLLEELTHSFPTEISASEEYEKYLKRNNFCARRRGR